MVYGISVTTEEIASKYYNGGFTEEESPSSSNNSNKEPTFKLQQKVEDYILLTQTRTLNNNLKTATIHAATRPIMLFSEMNDIILNWKKINRLLPRPDKNASDEAYTREQVKKMLEHSDLRTKIPILFMASSGMRLGGFCGLTDGCIRAIYDDGDDNDKTTTTAAGKILAAHVVVYKGEPEEYDTFISPEAWSVYEEYRNLRISLADENITENSPILLRRFDISPDGKTAKIDNTKSVSLSTVAGLIKTAAYKAGIRQPSKKYNERYNVKIAHGFRKFFSTTLSNVRTPDGRQAIDFLKKEMLMGHALTGIHSLEGNYNRTPNEERVRMLLDEYLKAVKELTISNEERLEVEVKKLQTDISNMKSVEMQLAAKDKEVDDMKSKFDLMQSQVQVLISTLGSMDQLSKNELAKKMFENGIYKPLGVDNRKSSAENR
jgi:integrase